ncbi:MAG: hypothetical protein KY464_16640 [Gemmatimonadetes bacterium]|nr:hypothetical protein [Gemmatimonadota bacterium]
MKLTSLSLLPLFALAGCLDDSTSPDLEKRVFSILGGLDVGEVLELRGGGAEDIPLSGGSEYLVVPFNATSREGETRLQVEFTGTNVQGLSSASRVPNVHGFPGAPVPLRLDQSFHDRLRSGEQSLHRLAPAARRFQAGRTVLPGSALAVPAEGEILRLNVNTNSACSSPIYRDARVMAVTSRAIVVADVQNPAGGFTPAEFREVALAFDTLVWKVDTRNFGVPSDIDRNERVTIFFTSTVNALTPRGAPNGFVGGYFWSRDLFPTTAQAGVGGCAGSNAREMFYMLAADPQGSVNGNVFSKQQVLRSTVAVTAHEFEHLINASRRLYVNRNARSFEESWLDEGLAHIAEEQVFYESSGLNPGMNIDLAQVQGSGRARTALNMFMLANIGRYWSYLEKPSEESLLGVDAPLETRGAIWSFLRYAADGRAGPDEEFFYALANSDVAGVQNLARVLKQDPIDLMQSWTASVYLDDAAPAGLDEKYRQRSWNMRSLIGFLNDGVFPLEILRLNGSGKASVGLKGGGAAFLIMGAAEGHQGLVRTTADAKNPPDELRISVVRLR